MKTIVDWTKYSHPWNEIGPSAAREFSDIVAGKSPKPKMSRQEMASRKGWETRRMKASLLRGIK